MSLLVCAAGVALTKIHPELQQAATAPAFYSVLSRGRGASDGGPGDSSLTWDSIRGVQYMDSKDLLTLTRATTRASLEGTSCIRGGGHGRPVSGSGGDLIGGGGADVSTGGSGDMSIGVGADVSGGAGNAGVPTGRQDPARGVGPLGGSSSIIGGQHQHHSNDVGIPEHLHAQGVGGTGLIHDRDNSGIEQASVVRATVRRERLDMSEIQAAAFAAALAANAEQGLSEWETPEQGLSQKEIAASVTFPTRGERPPSPFSETPKRDSRATQPGTNPRASRPGQEESLPVGSGAGSGRGEWPGSGLGEQRSVRRGSVRLARSGGGGGSVTGYPLQGILQRPISDPLPLRR